MNNALDKLICVPHQMLVSIESVSQSRLFWMTRPTFGRLFSFLIDFFFRSTFVFCPNFRQTEFFQQNPSKIFTDVLRQIIFLESTVPYTAHWHSCGLHLPFKRIWFEQNEKGKPNIWKLMKSSFVLLLRLQFHPFFTFKSHWCSGGTSQIQVVAYQKCTQ